MMNELQTRIYEFDEFRIDAAKRLLLKGDGEIVPLMPKAFDTLLYLVQNSGKVIEKNELMAEIRRAIELDPLSLRNNAVEGQILFFRRQK